MKIWAHRGCCTRYPENTLTSFEAACQYEIDGIELDIQLTSDGELVVIHDETVDRTTNGTGYVKDFTLAEIKKLEIAAPEGKTEHIPTMREVLELMKPYCLKDGVCINIELKNSKIRYEGMERKILDLVAEFGLEPYIVYSSFNAESIVLLKQMDASVQTGILQKKLTDCCGLEAATGCDALHCDADSLDEPNLRAWTAAPVRAWNVTEPKYPITKPNVAYDIKELEQKHVTDIIVNQPELYVQKRRPGYYKQVPIMLHAGVALDQRNGGYGQGFPARMTSLIVLPAPAGSRIRLINGNYQFCVATYTKDILPEFVYTYSYDRDAAWVTYAGTYTEDNFSQRPYIFDKDCFFRVCVRRVDGRAIAESEAAAPEKILTVEQPAERAEARTSKSFFRGEIAATALAARWHGRGSLRFALLADSHYVTNGFWEDTVNNLMAVNEKAPFDGIVHLGDFTDGILPAPETAEMTKHCIRGLQALGKPLLVVPGNHDSAYFRDNPEPLSEEQEQQLLYSDVLPDDVVRLAGKFWYYRDIAEHKLRILTLFSHDFRANPRYGFPDEELAWVRETLATVPEGWKVLVLSHCPPLPELHYWSKDIANGPRLIAMLDEYNAEPGRKVLAFLHGHNHCEQICRTHTFPIVSIGCAKCEYFPDKKPEGSHTELRQMGHRTQELWDVLLVDTKRDTLRFIRFGAGKDRLIEC